MVPGGVMRDFLIKFRTRDFYQKVEGLMEAIPGNTYAWRNIELMQTAMSYSMESMIHQIMDQLGTIGDILLEGE
jgi:hypothetical protein